MLVQNCRVSLLLLLQVSIVETRIALVTAVYSIIVLDGRPGLTELQQFTTKEGKFSVNLLQDVGAKYDGFGTCLLDDTHGSKMAAIQSDHRTVETKMRDIFTKWLQGMI